MEQAPNLKKTEDGGFIVVTNSFGNSGLNIYKYDSEIS